MLINISLFCLLGLQNVREQLEETLPGTGGGRNPNDHLLVRFLFLLPFCALLFCYYRSFLQVSGYIFFIYLFKSSIKQIHDSFWISYYIISCRHGSTLDHYVEVHYAMASDTCTTKLDLLDHLLILVFLHHLPSVPTLMLVSSSTSSDLELQDHLHI